MISIYKKELRSYFTTFTGYAFLGFFVLITCYFFAAQNLAAYSANYNDVLVSTMIMFLILVPVLTMRSFAEESRQKTDQLLMTSPITINAVVLGKFLAAVTLYLMGILITAVFPFILSKYGTVDVSATVCCFIGYFLMGSCLISVGIFISVLTDNQIVAAAGTFCVLFLLLMIDNIASGAPITRASSLIFAGVIAAAVAAAVYTGTKSLAASCIFALVGAAVIGICYLVSPTVFDGLITRSLGWLSELSRFENFYLGVFGISDVVYYITFSGVFLFLTVNSIEKRRWS